VSKVVSNSHAQLAGRRMMRSSLRCWFVIACLALPAALGGGIVDEQEKAPFDPTENYDQREIEGWSVLVNRSFEKDDAALCARTLELLRFQLYQITRVVPAGALEKLRTVRIWVERAEPHHPCMAYHPDAGWLREHDMNPAKAHCVEVTVHCAGTSFGLVRPVRWASRVAWR
jgi:hypothetical protein